MPMGGTMPGAAPAAAAPPEVAEEDIPTQKEQTHFAVRLTEAKPVDKVKLIKEIKNYVQGINLVQVSSVPHGPLPAVPTTRAVLGLAPSGAGGLRPPRPHS